MEDTNLTTIYEDVDAIRVFVGNVPFDCNADEFNDVFRDVDGFISTELVTRYQSDKTKGFGFVEFEKRVIGTIVDDKYELKGRMLRVEEYIEKSLDNEKISDIQKLFVRNIDGLTIIRLENYFSQFGTVVKCKLLNGINKFAVVCIKGNIGSQFTSDIICDIDGIKIQVSPYKKIKKSLNYQKKYNTTSDYTTVSNNYNNGIRDGKVIGFANGYKRGYQDAKNAKPYALIDYHISE
jgi:RNA recognition motif-containing protein